MQAYPEGPIWFQPNIRLLRLLRLGCWVIPLLVLALGYYLVRVTMLLFTGDDPDADLSDAIRIVAYLWIAALAMASFSMLIFFEVRRWTGYRLGLQSDVLLLKEGTGAVHRIEPRELIYGDGTLLWGKRQIPLKWQYSHLLNQAEDLERHLIPFLKHRAEYLDCFSMFGRQLARGEPVILSMCLLVVVLGVLIVLL